MGSRFSVSAIARPVDETVATSNVEEELTSMLGEALAVPRRSVFSDG